MNIYENAFCKYCCEKLILNFAEGLICSVCNNKVHLKCLKRGIVPGGILGDTFFKYTCRECSITKKEEFVRNKMTWFQLIILGLYNLENGSIISQSGFYHWKSHLLSFIIHKRKELFPEHQSKIKKNWEGTVAGGLSVYSPHYIISGAHIIGVGGWWKLAYPKLTPTTIAIFYNYLSKNKDYNPKKVETRILLEKMIQKYLPNLSKTIQFYSPELLECIDSNEDIKIEKPNFTLTTETHLTFSHDKSISNVIKEANLKFIYKNEEQLENLVKKNPQIITPSLFKQSTVKFDTLWKEKRTVKLKNNKSLKFMSPEQEKRLYNYLSKNCKTRFERALKRKLHLRNLKRKFNLPMSIEDFDKWRYYNCIKYLPDRNVVRGPITSDGFFISPYTQRLLKPYIRRIEKPDSVWLQLMYELKMYVATKKNISFTLEIASLDFCYVQPNHIPVITSLCERFFWPGIDLTDTLECPEFSCVVFYKRIVIAFGFMVPNYKVNETYISFLFTRPDWRKQGIATFIIYHLIQTCMGKDITLHVGLDNPAIFLYQKFGFKVKKIVHNFYSNYIRDDNKACKHAFYMKLEV